MSEYYCFATEAEAQACLDYINNTPWFPIIGNRNGEPAYTAQATTRWAEAPLEMASGEWCVPRIEESRLDALNVPQGDRDQFMAAFGQDIRELSASNFPPPPEE